MIPLSLKDFQLIGVQGGDSWGRSVKTQQERSDEEAEGKPPGKRPPGTEINVISVY